MSIFLDRLAAGDVLISDGATGTNLHRMGLKPGVTPEELVIDNPDLLLELEKSFVDAGSDIILTCTFGGSNVRMQETKYSGRAVEINFKAARLARQATNTRPGVMVGGSIGPIGKLLKPYGPVQPEEAFETYSEQTKALVDGGVDLLVIETHFQIEEGKVSCSSS